MSPVADSASLGAPGVDAAADDERRASSGWSFHGWRVVAAAAATQAVQSGLFMNSYGNYAVVLRDQFGWSKTALSLGFSATRMEAAIIGPAQGAALDRYGNLVVMRIGVVLLSLSFLGLGQVQELWQFFVVLGVLSLGASLSGFLSVTVAVVRWFERKRARAISLGTLGFAVGGAMAPLLVFLLERLGWRWTISLAGVAAFLILWPLTAVFHGAPVDRGQFIDGIDPSTIDDDEVRAEGVSDVHLTAPEALRTRAFWMISLGHGAALLVVSSVMAHLSLYLTSEQDFSLQRASLVGGALPIFQMVGMLVGGQLGDRFNKRRLSAGAMLGHMTGLLMLTYPVGTWMIWLFVPIHGLSWGIRGPLMQALRADFFGSTHFGRIMGYSSVIVMFGSAGGPLFAGVLADSTGSYRSGFTVIALVAGAAMMFFVWAKAPTLDPKRTAASA